MNGSSNVRMMSEHHLVLCKRCERFLIEESYENAYEEAKSALLVILEKEDSDSRAWSEDEYHYGGEINGETNHVTRIGAVWLQASYEIGRDGNDLRSDVQIIFGSRKMPIMIILLWCALLLERCEVREASDVITEFVQKHHCNLSHLDSVSICQFYQQQIAENHDVNGLRNWIYVNFLSLKEEKKEELVTSVCKIIRTKEMETREEYEGEEVAEHDGDIGNQIPFQRTSSTDINVSDEKREHQENDGRLNVKRDSLLDYVRFWLLNYIFGERGVNGIFRVLFGMCVAYAVSIEGMFFLRRLFRSTFKKKV